jgi:hypothetical protein
VYGNTAVLVANAIEIQVDGIVTTNQSSTKQDNGQNAQRH